jgi:hypothetical protein
MSQSVELVFPKLLVVCDPRRRILHGLGDEAAAVHPAVLVTPHQPGVFEHVQVLQNPGQ